MIDCSSVSGSGSGNEDIKLEISPNFDIFWSSIRSDGFDVVLVTNTGQKANFKRQIFNYSLKQLTIEGQNIPITKGTMSTAFLYFDFPDQVVDESVAFSTTSPVDSYVYEGQPSGFLVAQRQTATITESPIVIFQKDPIEEISVWFSLGGLLQKRKTKSRDSLIFDELSHLEVESIDSSGTNDTGRFKIDESRFIDGFVLIKAIAGVDGESYALRVKITTILGYVFVLQCQIKVIKLLPVSG